MIWVQERSRAHNTKGGSFKKCSILPEYTWLSLNKNRSAAVLGVRTSPRPSAQATVGRHDQHPVMAEPALGISWTRSRFVRQSNDHLIEVLNPSIPGPWTLLHVAILQNVGSASSRSHSSVHLALICYRPWYWAGPVTESSVCDMQQKLWRSDGWSKGKGMKIRRSKWLGGESRWEDPNGTLTR